MGAIASAGVLGALLFQVFSGIHTDVIGVPLVLIAGPLLSAFLVMMIFDLARTPPRLAARAARPVEKPAVDPAMTAALESRQRRAEARRIVERDPLLAVELKIGRPDLGQAFNDGGLVDLNGAPAPVIAHVCGIDLSLAERIVEGRSSVGAFHAVDDVFSIADLPVHMWNRIRDRAVVIHA
jgi:DNA uptake protein ComE-like DNA-binding protein